MMIEDAFWCTNDVKDSCLDSGSAFKNRCTSLKGRASSPKKYMRISKYT